jgi:hypothetical protein
MAEYLETEKHLFSRILKNDWGKGGAWDFYWGAFYPKGGKRIKDAQLFLWVNHEILEFGFYIGEYGSEQRKRFLLNCKANQTSLVEILGDSLSDPNLIFGQWERRLEGGLAPKHLKDIEWKDWLSGPAGQGIHVAVVLRKEEVLSLTKQELTDRIANIFRQLFPLVILTASEDPLPEIANYVGLEEIDYEIRPAYSLAEFVDETGFEKSVIAGWEQRLRRKMHVVFQGPPGTGKTYVAERLARLMISETTGFWDIVQFHPAYAYEDFIQGIRPKLAHGGITYELADGRFMEFCRKARLEADSAPCVLIIDEINRAHLSRVFGELMYLLEYRKKEVPLAAGGPSFKIPKNVYLIGTMNTADRSIALVDHALRRRFSFIRLNPHYGVLKEHLEARGYSAGDLIGVLREINNAFDDPNYELGISFFMRDDDQLKTHLPDIWRGEIEPYLEEFFYDQPKKVAPFRWETLVENRLKDWAD